MLSASKMEVSQSVDTSRKKRVDDMSREELISVVKEKSTKLQVAEELFKSAEEEKQDLLVRVSQMIEAQKKQLEGSDGLTEKVIAERDLLKTKALELISRSKAAQTKIVELTAENARYQSEIQAREVTIQSLQTELVTLREGRNTIDLELLGP